MKEAIRSGQCLTDRAKEWWNTYTGPLGVALNALLHRIGLGETEITKFDAAGGKLGQLSEQMEILGELSVKLGYRCTYVLIDKVDESSITGKASTSFQFIQPLLSDLQILESNSFAFKFFLWDLLMDNYREVSRPDRVKYYQLSWDQKQLLEMLSRRLAAHSDQRVSSLESICEDSGKHIDQIVVLFAQGSPRNIIRICKEIFDQQSEVNSSSKKISTEALVRGFEIFAKNYTNEIVSGNVIRDLQKLKRADFTIKFVYNDVFKFTQQAGISKIKTWLDCGVVEQIGVVQETKGVRSSNHYGLTNPLVLKYIMPELNVFDLYNRKMRSCKCGQLLLRDWDLNDTQTCQSCQQEWQRESEA